MLLAVPVQALHMRSDCFCGISRLCALGYIIKIRAVRYTVEPGAAELCGELKCMPRPNYIIISEPALGRLS